MKTRNEKGQFVKKNRTGIVIKTEKVLIRGKQERKIVDVKMLYHDDLPVEYTSQEKSVWLEKQDRQYISSPPCRWICNFYGCFFGISKIYSENKFQEIINFVKECGDHLQKINTRLAKENKNWHGKETFVI